jgi:hypothetical protein
MIAYLKEQIILKNHRIVIGLAHPCPTIENCYCSTIGIQSAQFEITDRSGRETFFSASGNIILTK